jgi:hypothetical protein
VHRRPNRNLGSRPAVQETGGLALVEHFAEDLEGISTIAG